MRCPKCGGYSFDSEGRCLGPKCGHVISTGKPPSWWGGKDFSVHRRSPKDRGKGNKEGHPNHDRGDVSPPELKDCPYCKHKSLFWNKYILTYECLDLSCKRFVAGQEINGVCEREIQSMDDLELSDPLWLGVKMFLADIRSWR
jgi:hypothetical protein